MIKKELKNKIIKKLIFIADFEINLTKLINTELDELKWKLLHDNIDYISIVATCLELEFSNNELREIEEIVKAYIETKIELLKKIN